MRAQREAWGPPRLVPWTQCVLRVLASFPEAEQGPETPVQTRALPLSSSVTLDKSLNLMCLSFFAYKMGV